MQRAIMRFNLSIRMQICFASLYAYLTSYLNPKNLYKRMYNNRTKRLEEFMTGHCILILRFLRLAKIYRNMHNKKTDERLAYLLHIFEHV